MGLELEPNALTEIETNRDEKRFNINTYSANNDVFYPIT